MGRAPIVGRARVHKPFELDDGAVGLAFAPLLFQKLGGDGFEGVGARRRLRGLGELLDEGGVLAISQKLLGLLQTPARASLKLTPPFL